jgi:hypothetical protein
MKLAQQAIHVRRGFGTSSVKRGQLGNAISDQRAFLSHLGLIPMARSRSAVPRSTAGARSISGWHVLRVLPKTQPARPDYRCLRSSSN